MQWQISTKAIHVNKVLFNTIHFQIAKFSETFREGKNGGVICPATRHRQNLDAGWYCDFKKAQGGSESRKWR